MNTDHATEVWPALPYEDWVQTYETVHRWMQVVGKVKLALSPFLNEWWEVAFTLTARGFTTGTIPFQNTVFEIRFDFVRHNLEILLLNGSAWKLDLEPMSVAEFYKRFMGGLNGLGIAVSIDPKPAEIEDPIPCDIDHVHCSYDADAINRCWRIFAQSDRVFQKFRSGFSGKSSPVQFFWGGFDLSITRFSGKPCHADPGSNKIMRLTNDEEHYAAGFWPGNKQYPAPAFYAYAAPVPPGYYDARIQPNEARFESAMGEFILPYEAVRNSESPDEDILAFLNSTYSAQADLAKWDRAFLERELR